METGGFAKAAKACWSLRRTVAQWGLQHRLRGLLGESVRDQATYCRCSCLRRGNPGLVGRLRRVPEDQGGRRGGASGHRHSGRLAGPAAPTGSGGVTAPALPASAALDSSPSTRSAIGVVAAFGQIAAAAASVLGAPAASRESPPELSGTVAELSGPRCEPCELRVVKEELADK